MAGMADRGWSMDKPPVTVLYAWIKAADETFPSAGSGERFIEYL